MTTHLLNQPPAAFSTPLLVVFAADTATAKDAPATPTLLTTDAAILTAANPWLTSGEFKATLGETLLLATPSGIKAERLLIIGTGKSNKPGSPAGVLGPLGWKLTQH
ncbi:MAG: M17 family peptidase N-terminal domain-containing protein, partial [Acidobacteriaceae bacterium]